MDHPNVYSWQVENARSGRSKCHGSQCIIPKGAVRIGAEVDSSFIAGSTMVVWYLPEALFSHLHKGPATRTLLVSVDQLRGFSKLSETEQERIRALIQTEASFWEKLDAAAADHTEYFLNRERKFWWAILVVGSSSRTSWGQLGEAANVSEKKHASVQEASNYKKRLVNEKIHKGYVASNSAVSRVMMGACKCNCGCKVCCSKKTGLKVASSSKRKPCAFFRTANGCSQGAACQFYHGNDGSEPSR